MAVLKQAGISALAPDIEGTSEVLDSVGRNSGLLKWLHRRDVSQGNAVKVEAITTTNSSAATFSEDDAITAQAPTISEGSFSMQEFQCAWGLTGSALREAGQKGGLVLEANRADALRALISYIEGYYCSSKAAAKIIGQIDDDTTAWGSVNRGVTTALKSHVVAGGAATVTAAKLYDATRGVRDAPFIGEPEVILSSPTQLELYLGSVVAAPSGQPGGSVGNAGFAAGPAMFGSLPWFEVRGMLNSVILVLTGVYGGSAQPMHFWYNFQPDGSNWLDKYGASSAVVPFVVGDGYAIGNMAISTLGMTDESVGTVAVTAGAYVCAGPAGQAMIEALATS